MVIRVTILSSSRYQSPFSRQIASMACRRGRFWRKIVISVSAASLVTAILYPAISVSRAATWARGTSFKVSWLIFWPRSAGIPAPVTSWRWASSTPSTSVPDIIVTMGSSLIVSSSTAWGNSNESAAGLGKARPSSSQRSCCFWLHAVIDNTAVRSIILIRSCMDNIP